MTDEMTQEPIPTHVDQEMLDENPELKAAGVTVGTEIQQLTDEEVAQILPPVEPGTAGDEPRKRYRGVIILSESERVVGEQTFHHIHCINGTEYDLTDIEYNGEVHVSQ